jgi:amino acid permease
MEMEHEKKPEYDIGVDASGIESSGGFVENIDGLHRRLSNRQIQWIAIGGAIGTALFVTIAWGLVEGGPGSLLVSNQYLQQICTGPQRFRIHFVCFDGFESLFGLDTL